MESGDDGARRHGLHTARSSLLAVPSRKILQGAKARRCGALAGKKKKARNAGSHHRRCDFFGFLLAYDLASSSANEKPPRTENGTRAICVQSVAFPRSASAEGRRGRVAETCRRGLSRAF